MDPALVMYHAQPLADVVVDQTSRERLAFVLMETFAGLSLLLAMLGLYGVLAYDIRQRTPEIGIRMALGATAGRIRRDVLGQARTMVSGGMVIGGAGDLARGRWMSAMTFDTSPWDVRIFLATVLVVGATALAAAWLPARRAARTAPRTAIQEVA